MRWTGLERRSDKHSPRVDDELRHEVEPLERGAPVEPHVEEYREQEPAGDDEPVVDARRVGGRTAGGPMGVDELEARSELARSVSPSVFPADRQALLDSARANHARQPVVDLLTALPADQVFDNAEAVWQALGGHNERRR
jgi:hypothetical protein